MWCASTAPRFRATRTRRAASWVTTLRPAVYYNINVNEDRDAALAESKRYLDAYYTTDYSEPMLNLWVAMGTPEQCIADIQEYVDAGATTITLRLVGYDQQHQYRRVTEEVLPALTG